MTAAGVGALLFRARGLALGYRGRNVLSGVDLDIHAGEIWFVLGRNGSGKSTLLRALLGLLPPRAGELERRNSLAQVGFVPQRCDLGRSLPTTVREFVSLGLVGTRASEAERVERFAWALERAGLAGLEQADYWALSGGQRQRALVARALVRRPAVLLLDEPTEGLDIGSEESLLETLADLNRRDALTLVFVTHELAFAARHASHVALVDRGGVTAGPRDAILRADVLGPAFGIAFEPDALARPGAGARS